MPEAKPKSVYYLQFQGTEFGPMTLKDMESVMQAGKLKGELYVWADGMPNWLAIHGPEDLKTLQSKVTDLVQKREAKKVTNPAISTTNRRGGNRQSVVATVALIEASRPVQVLGLCEDLSLTGLQILLAGEDPGMPVGSTIDLEVRPLAASGLTAFRMTAKVMWVKAAEKSIGVQILKIADPDSRALRSYIELAERRAVKS